MGGGEGRREALPRRCDFLLGSFKDDVVRSSGHLHFVAFVDDVVWFSRVFLDRRHAGILVKGENGAGKEGWCLSVMELDDVAVLIKTNEAHV